MRFQSRAIWIAVNLCSVQAFSNNFIHSKQIRGHTSSPFQRPNSMHQMSAVMKSSANSKKKSVPVTPSPTPAIDYESINKLTFRELQRECRDNGLSSTGSTATLRNRLLELHGGLSSVIADTIESPEEVCVPDGIQFCDESDPDFDYKALLSEVLQKANIGHWKAATRKLKQLQKRFSKEEKPESEEAYIAVLHACAQNRLQGARAAEPARKIMEEMADRGIPIPSDAGNSCVVDCLGSGPNGTHDGFGGIDTALAMLAAMERSQATADTIKTETYTSVISALNRDGAFSEAILLLRTMVVDRFLTPNLNIFSEVAQGAVKDKEEQVLQVMTLAKAAGYVLDNVASSEAGRSLLATGVIAAEKLGNVALGLRLLTAASKAEGCSPDAGDALVAASSSAAQRACMLIHKRAIDDAIAEGNWKLAVKILELMPARSLIPSANVLRKVVNICAKSGKSRKATAILLDWIKLAEEGKLEVPPVNVFNTVVNTCEICGEEELTLVVLEAMKKAHKTDGNIITFNIALKRLSKQGQVRACEGIMIGMLEAGVEPNVVSYTTCIGACAQNGDSAFAYEWLRRMRSRNVNPNFHTYNTALAACLDGKLQSTIRGSSIAREMMADVAIENKLGLIGPAEYNSVMPDLYTKTLARNLMKQLRDNWRAGEIDMAVAKATVRVPLLKLVDFEKSQDAPVLESVDDRTEKSRNEDDDDTEVRRSEAEVDFNAVILLSQSSHRRVEV